MPDHAVPADSADQPAVSSSEHGGVDEVLAFLNNLDGLPVADHVPVFERAHEQLRRALDVPRSS